MKYILYFFKIRFCENVMGVDIFPAFNYVAGVHGDQKRASNPLELDLWMAVSYYNVSAWN